MNSRQIHLLNKIEKDVADLQEIVKGLAASYESMLQRMNPEPKPRRGRPRKCQESQTAN